MGPFFAIYLPVLLIVPGFSCYTSFSFSTGSARINYIHVGHPAAKEECLDRMNHAVVMGGIPVLRYYRDVFTKR